MRSFMIILHVALFIGLGEGLEDIERLRLQGGEKYSEGNVEIFFEDEWRPVSDDEFGMECARVVCNALGYKSQRVLYSLDSFYGKPEKKTIRFACSSRAKALNDCVIGKGGYNQRVGGVDCTPDFENVEVRLVGGQLPLKVGQLEVKVKGKWGGVCDRDFDAKDAEVVCRQLGYSGVNAFPIVPWKEERNITYVMENPVCIGNETNLGECKTRPWGNSYQRYYHVGVACLTDKEIGEHLQVLLGPSHSEEPDTGHLLVGIGGVWGTVCREAYSISGRSVPGATFFCKRLGYQWGKVMWDIYPEAGIFDYLIWLKTINCIGNESSVTECKQLEWTPGIDECYDQRTSVIRCFYENPPSDPVVERVTPGPMIVDKEFQLRCWTTTERPENVTIRWYCDLRYRDEGTSKNGTHVVSAITLNKLERYSNYKWCACYVHTSLGWFGSARTQLNIMFGPNYRWRDGGISVPDDICEGHVVSLSCRFGFSRPRPRIFWYFNDVLMRDLNVNSSCDPTSTYYSPAYGGCRTTSDVSFNFTRSLDGTVVKCVAWNDITERKIEMRTTLQMKKVITPLAQVKVIQEEAEPKLTFKCNATGVSTKKPTWIVRNDTIVSPIPYFSMASHMYDLDSFRCRIETEEGVILLKPVLLSAEDEFRLLLTPPLRDSYGTLYISKEFHQNKRIKELRMRTRLRSGAARQLFIHSSGTSWVAEQDADPVPHWADRIQQDLQEKLGRFQSPPPPFLDLLQSCLHLRHQRFRNRALPPSPGITPSSYYVDTMPMADLKMLVFGGVRYLNSLIHIEQCLHFLLILRWFVYHNKLFRSVEGRKNKESTYTFWVDMMSFWKEKLPLLCDGQSWVTLTERDAHRADKGKRLLETRQTVRDEE